MLGFGGAAQPTPEQMAELAKKMPGGFPGAGSNIAGLPPNMPGNVPGLPNLPPNFPGGLGNLPGGKFPGLPGLPGLGKKK
jgi:signal recognition particle subunit SRP54